jgi:hypothetical protein
VGFGLFLFKNADSNKKELTTVTELLQNTVGAEIMACTKIMARSTSGDDFMHLKTSHIKSRVIL